MKYRLKENETKCLECGDTIVYGRMDKKFCCLECKNAYHNRTRHAEDRIKSRVYSKIKTNYAVLAWMLAGNRTYVKLDELAMMGFDPAFYPTCEQEKSHRIYTCFDISYRMSLHKVFNVRKMSNFV